MATPMTASKLVEILKAEGVVVKTPHSGWSTHERDDETGKAFGPVNGVMIHHTAGLGVGNVVYNGYSGLPGPLCHGYIRKDGAVEMCSAGRANHAGGGDPNVLNQVIAESYGTKPSAPQYHDGSAGAADGNDRFYGYECENKGDGKDPWPRVQYVAMVKAATAICRYYGWSEKSVIGHLEWSNWKIDPRGFTMAQFRADVKSALSMSAGAWSASEEALVADKQDVETLFTTDGVIKSPDYKLASESNKFWTAESYFYETYRRAREAKAAAESNTALVRSLVTKVDAQAVAISELAKAVATLSTNIDADDLISKIEAAIEGVTVRLEVPDNS